MGHKFGADWFGKLKTVLQCVAIIAILLLQSIGPADYPTLDTIWRAVLYAMLAATVDSRRTSASPKASSHS